MSRNCRTAFFAGLYIALFVASMWTITGGVMDIAAAVSAPVILCAEVLVLGMVYMTTYHGEAPHENHAPLQAYKDALQKVAPREKQLHC